MRILLFFILISFVVSFTFSQNIERICPPNWWVNMNNNELQLMIHGDSIADYNLSINYPGITIQKISKVENPNYLFIDLVINANTTAGTFNINFKKGNESLSYKYELKQREKRTFNYGLDASDFIYLLMPDRFSNGDETNDVIAGMKETALNRNVLTDRHGGDLQGIINHLDYIENLGATAVWCTPLLENDMSVTSYHGYAATDHYKIDPRYGSNELYKKYSDESHARELKVVMDVVHNHVGTEHWFIKDLPMHNWINQWDTFTRTNYRAFALMDNYASDYDKKLMSDGWFDKNMPDLNQRNPYLAKYVIQNNIWWIEYAHVDAFRLDTYPYSDLQFLIDWKKAIDKEYSGFGIFGEAWVQGIAVQAYFDENNNLKTGYNSLLPGVIDFNLYWSLLEAINGKFGWTDGVANIYLTLVQDYMYGDVFNNVIFLGNHDLSRFFSEAGEDVNKFKMAVAFLMTMRGIPQWYYGDEILMKNFTNPDGQVREDFLGGWSDDIENKYDVMNLKPDEKEAFNYVKKLANWRKNAAVIHTGKLMQFAPSDGVYAYFRYNNDACVMVVMNSKEKEVLLDIKPYAERLTGYSRAKNVISDVSISNPTQITIPAMSCEIFELTR
jgi:glycosidase